MERESNGCVVIFSRDAVFARMLTLEIGALGISSRFSDDVSALRGVCGEDGTEGVITLADSELLKESAGNEEFDVFSPQIEFGYGEKPVTSADHYLRRPFKTDELLRLIRGLMGQGDKARSDNAPEAARAARSDSKPSESGLTYDNRKNSFRYNGEELSFTETEHSLLMALYKNRGEEISRERLLTEVWGRTDECERKSNLTDVYIRYLREKLDDRFGVRLIYSVRGKGYKLI